jgi:Fe-S-cluster-containing dehydrogenase component/CRP-like cAMP-binding protein
MPTSPTVLTRPQRWDEPFGAEMSDELVQRLLSIEPFVRMDPASFPRTTPLAGILRNDARVVELRDGDLIVREGDYGSSAFLVLHGRVRIALESLTPQLLGREAPQRGSLWQALAPLWRRAKPPELRPALSARDANGKVAIRSEHEQTRVFLQDVPAVISETRTAQLRAGELFGELSALARTPRSATVFADGAVTLLEIRWQGLRDLMKYTPALLAHIHSMYRQNSLRVHLRETQLLANLSAEQLSVVEKAVEFQSYGSFDWHTDLAKPGAADFAQRITREPIVAEEGELPLGIMLVRTGFGRVTERFGEGNRTRNYLAKGAAFGAAELACMALTGAPTPLRHTLRAVGHLDLLYIPAAVFTQVIAPTLPRDELHRLASEAAPVMQPSQLNALADRTLDFLVDQRLINGVEAMVINLDRCTRCDDCVRACASTHDGNPRFVRDGVVHDRFQFAHACMHCADPVCLIGCPTGAIHRDQTTGVVQINDRTCIGCGTCANSCPYTNIQMVEVRRVDGAIAFDPLTGQPIVKAAKCDLCVSNNTSPVCQKACPHDALVRIDLTSPSAFAMWSKR